MWDVIGRSAARAPQVPLGPVHLVRASLAGRDEWDRDKWAGLVSAASHAELACRAWGPPQHRGLALFALAAILLPSPDRVEPLDALPVAPHNWDAPELAMARSEPDSSGWMQRSAEVAPVGAKVRDAQVAEQALRARVAVLHQEKCSRWKARGRHWVAVPQ
jgi:hypothetical protein